MLKTLRQPNFQQFGRQILRNYSMEQKLVIKGQTINYVRQGTGNHALLCFPGALGTIWSDFRPQIEKLDQEKFTIVAFDPAGYGHSRPADRKFGVDFYEKDAQTANDFMQAIGLPKYTVLGWSDGGISGLVMAARYKESIRKLVIWGANSFILPQELESYEKIRDISKWSPKMKQPLIDLYTEEGLQRMWNDWCDTVQEIYREKQGNICKDILGDIQCPTLILHGDLDPMVDGVHPGYLQKHIKNSILHRFPKGKHNIHLRYADEFNTIVTKFLENSKL